MKELETIQEYEMMDDQTTKAMKVILRRKEGLKSNPDFESRLHAKLLQQVPTHTQSSAASIRRALVFAVLLLVIVSGLYLYLPILLNQNNGSKNIAQNTQNIISTKFAHYSYLPTPTFSNTISSSIAAPSEYHLKNDLPTSSQVLEKSKITLIPTAYAESTASAYVYRANRHQLTEDDATELAAKFGFTTGGKKVGTTPPAYYGTTWDTDLGHFEVTGGSGTGGYEYFPKNGTTSGTLPSDTDVIKIAKDFLQQKGLIDDTFIVSGVLGNVSDISRRSGYQENHKQIYFRKKVDSYPVFDWNIGGGSPIADRIEVWVGLNGRVIYAIDDTYFTHLDPNNKVAYELKDTTAVYNDIKNGKGKLAWLDYDAINISTGGYGPSAPDNNFAIYGKLKDVEITGVKLAYYHEQKGIEDSEFYQPIYIFTAQATLDWKDGYDLSNNEADRYIIGKRTTVTLIAPAVSDTYFFDKTAPNSTSVQAPIYYPEATSSASPSSFYAKLGLVKQLNGNKREVTISWSSVPSAVKYNVYLKVAGDKDYYQTAIVGTGELSTTISVNKYYDYYFKVQACTSTTCQDSTEVFLSQEQVTTFNLNLNSVTDRDNPKTDVNLNWDKLAGVTTYNIFLKNAATESYNLAQTSTGNLQTTVSVNRHNDNYFIVQACNQDSCFTSSEVFLPKK
jgi:hypothetical protein